MEAYLGPILVFLGALIAVKGGTWDSTKPLWIKRITVTGWITISISMFGLVLALWSANASQIEKEQMSAKITKLTTHAEEQQKRLKKANSDLNRVRLSLSKAENLAQISSSREQLANKQLQWITGQDKYIKNNIARIRAANNKILKKLDLLIKTDSQNESENKKDQR